MIWSFKTPQESLEALTRHLAIKPGSIPGGGGAQAYDLILQAESMDYDFNLADYWVGANRWKLMTRQYVNQESLDHWHQLIDSHLSQPKSHGVAFLRSSLVKGTKRGVRETRRWGSCMIGWSFRRFPTPHFSMHSRSTYLGYLAPLDLGVAAHLADSLTPLVGIPIEDMSFTWHIEQATFHGFRSMAWWYLDNEHRELLNHTNSDAAKKTRSMAKRFEKMDAEGVLYGDMAYAQERRFRMKWHSERGIDVTPFLGVGKKAEVKANPPLPSTSLWDLELIPGNRSTERFE